MSRVIAALVFACVAFAQKAPEPELLTAAKSPNELARYIDSHTGFDWTPLWQLLRITGASVLPCEGSGDCSTRLITIPDPQQTILIIDTEWNTEVCIRYLGSEAKGWQWSEAYFAFIKYYPRRQEVARIGGKPFLRVSSTGNSGIGVGSEVEDWIDLTQRDFKPVFGVILQGQENRLNRGINRSIESSVSSGVVGQTETIDVSVSVRYSGGSDFEVDLGEVHYSVKYERRSGQKTFRRREIESNPPSSITEAKFDKLMDLAKGPSNEKILVYALPGLKEVASGTNAVAKEWLRLMLGGCKDTVEKRLLLELASKP